MNTRIFSAIVAVVVPVAYASAALNITSAHVSRSYTYGSLYTGVQPGPAGSTVVFDGPADNSFSAYDGYAGARATTSASSVTVGAISWGTPTYPGNSQIAASSGTSGTVQFEVQYGSFTAVPGGGSLFGVGSMKLTQLATGKTWSFVGNPFVSPAPTSGDLAMPAGPGAYELTFSQSSAVANGISSTAGVFTTLNFVPEPASPLALASASVLLRRRRMG